LIEEGILFDFIIKRKANHVTESLKDNH